MRIPDGGGINTNSCGQSGSGTSAYGCMSLSKLRDSNVSLMTVDKSTTYFSWIDLYQTVVVAMQIFEFPRNTNTWINSHEFDRTINANSHPDHYATADIARSIQLANQGVWKHAYFVDYNSVNYPSNVNQAAHDIKWGCIILITQILLI